MREVLKVRNVQKLVDVYGFRESCSSEGVFYYEFGGRLATSFIMVRHDIITLRNVKSPHLDEALHMLYDMITAKLVVKFIQSYDEPY